MPRTLGPLLALHGAAEARWQVSALCVFAGEGELPTLHYESDAAAGTGQVSPEVVDRMSPPGLEPRRFVRFRFDVDMLEDLSQGITYWLSDGGDGETWTFAVPDAGFRRLRIGYATCNGFADAKTARDVDHKFERWDAFLAEHDDAPFHLLLLGGDQIYADPVFERASALRRWAEKDGAAKWRAAFTQTMRGQAERFYIERYESCWTGNTFAEAGARVPMLMMWDDHDIFDGWGSHDPERNQSPVYQGLFAAAERVFEALQLHNMPGRKGVSALVDDGPNKTYAVKLGPVVVLALDMRSERTPERVISQSAWTQIHAWLDQALDGETAHLLVMSSVPLVHLDFGAVESAMNLMPGAQSYEDDLRDHWMSRPHRRERQRLIHKLFHYAQAKRTRVTVLSGDIHVAGVGVLEDRRRPSAPAEESTITQLISSPVVHPVPPKVLMYAYDALALFESEEEVEPGLYARMSKVPGSDHRFLARRNWLDLQIEPRDADGRVWANWRPEDADAYTIAIHKIDRDL